MEPAPRPHRLEPDEGLGVTVLPKASDTPSWRPLAAVVIMGLLAGVILDLTAYWVALAGPSGDGWSFRGNGALVVPLGLGPAVLGGGWSALVLLQRRAERWIGIGIATALVGAVPVVASVGVLVLLGRAGQILSDRLTVLMFAWPAVSVILAAVVPVSRSARQAPGRWATAMGAALFTLALAAGFAAAAGVLPPGT